MADFAVAPLDRAAIEMDRKWGIDRLPELVEPAMALKYGAAMAYMNAAIGKPDPAAAAQAAANCIKGLQAMDAAATAAGHKPLSPQVWEVEIDGEKYAILREVGDWRAFEDQRPGVKYFTMREVAVALHASRHAVITVRDAIKGAEMTAIRTRTALENELNDEIPF